MTINVNNLEKIITEKMNSASTEKEMLEYAKIIEKLKTGTVQVVATFGDLPVATDHEGELYYVTDEKTVYWANAEYGWFTLETTSTSSLWQMGRVGNMYTEGTSSPIQECTLSSWCNVAAGSLSNHGIKTDGTLWSWGSNRCGVFGANGNALFNNSSPVQEFTSSNNWLCAKVSSYNISALKNDGSFWVWGYTFYGPTGVFGSDKISSPTQEFTSSTWIKTATDLGKSVGIKSDGTLWSWGGNPDGQLADGTTINRSSPVQEVSSSNIWAKLNFSVAIKTDGTLWGWGCNGYGMVGDGTTINRSSPIQEFYSANNWCHIDGNTDILNIALKSDGTLWSWGRNFFDCGHLGIGVEGSKSIPVQEISSSTNWCHVYTTWRNPTALKIDGTLWTWGDNSDGQLGDGTTISRSSPVQEVTSSTNWTCSNAETDNVAGLQNLTF